MKQDQPRNPAGRKPTQLRPITIETGVNLYAEGSALIKMGNTHVLCTASIEEKVPDWLKDKGRGWVTAEYSMLPRSTHTRSKRDREKVSGRTQEIQRLIARALRSMVDLKELNGFTITVDCDVLQADGGTRTASINGGCVALSLAIQKLRAEGKLKGSVQIGNVAAVSVGIQSESVLTDLDYPEDSGCDVDMNFVITGDDRFIEVQGTAEGAAFSKSQMDAMTNAALAATREIREIQKDAIKKVK